MDDGSRPPSWMAPDVQDTRHDIALLETLRDFDPDLLDLLHRHVNAADQRGYARAKREVGRPRWFEFSLLVAGCFIGQLFSAWWLG